MSWQVHKFGGSSLETPEKIKHVARLIQELSIAEDRIVIVLSAAGGVTDDLLGLYGHALKLQDTNAELEEIFNRHTEMVSELLNESKSQILRDEIQRDVESISHILESLRLSQSENIPLRDVIVGYGELWSSKIIANLLQDMGVDCQWIDSREVIIVNQDQGNTGILWDDMHLPTAINRVLIFPGFIAKSDSGAITTLGRNGSDLSASILSALFQAKELHIWTDVDGIYSADPRIVDDVIVLDHLSYLESLEMAYFGAKVLHPMSIMPVIDKNIPIRVRNTFNPDHLGTMVSLHSNRDTKVQFVKGFATIDSVALVTIEGAGMIGVPGISERLFRALRRAGISVIMISQASSEFSISVAVSEVDGQKAKLAVENEFDILLARGTIRGVKLENNCAILSVVGDNMVHQPGIASMLFSALSRARINVRMISQGSSERNISVILDQKDITKGLNTVHSAFYLSHVTVSIGIIGMGLIGTSLIKQLFQEKDNLKMNFNVDLQINGIANSRQMLLQKDLQSEDLLMITSGPEMNLDEFVSYIQRDSIPHTLIIDCTSSQMISESYPRLLQSGIHVITPNKKANSGSFDIYLKLREYIDKGPSTNPLQKNTYYFYETTVGAGLPVINTLRDLVNTGDTVYSIRGVFSGTLSYIFNTLKDGAKFSDVVKDAKDKGYTEPDPRDDLSGLDVARKLIILARELGMQIELDDVIVESLIPVELDAELNVEEFMQQLPDYDDKFTASLVEANANSQVLRYVGTIDASGRCSVGIQKIDTDHPFANLNGSENIISFNTARYHEYPLIVRGPGAGAEVTSAGVFSDILRLVERLGAV